MAVAEDEVELNAEAHRAPSRSGISWRRACRCRRQMRRERAGPVGGGVSSWGRKEQIGEEEYDKWGLLVSDVENIV